MFFFKNILRTRSTYYYKIFEIINMVLYFSNSLKIGLKIIVHQEPYEVQSSEFVKPGKGQAFLRVKLRQLLTGKLVLQTFKSTDILKIADVLEIPACYLYNDGTSWIFMGLKNFEHINVLKKRLYGCEKWLFNSINCIITLWNNVPIKVKINNFIFLKVKESFFDIKGDSVNSVTKIVKLVNGSKIRVPLFIKKGDLLKIDTRSGLYVSRKK